MKVTFVNSKKLILIAYKVILPIILAILLFVVSLAVPRPRFLGSDFLDFMSRIVLWLWLSIGYRSLPTLHDNDWKRKDRLRIDFNSDLEARIIYFAIGIGFCLMIYIFSSWTIETFIPVLIALRIPLAIVNSLLYFIPYTYKYHAFKSAQDQL
jgi:hypothetical protein